MKALLQRVSEAEVSVAGARIARIGRGLLVFVGFERADAAPELQWLVDKVLDIRVFPDTAKAMNRSLRDIDGELLVVSQFTLAADTSRGRRPGFSTAATPAQAEELYVRLVEQFRAQWPRVQTGRFGADMQVGLVNDGPVTFLLER